MIEEWRDVPGYSGHYMVSDLGRVKSVPRKVWRGGHRMSVRGGVMRPGRKPNGYLYVNLKMSGRTRTSYVHRLVLHAFTGNPGEGMDACHWNGERDDNRLENLRWGSRAENMADAIRHGTIKRAAQEREVRLGRRS